LSNKNNYGFGCALKKLQTISPPVKFLVVFPINSSATVIVSVYRLVRERGALNFFPAREDKQDKNNGNERSASFSFVLI
jgi:hypothetical protein